ncbi:hypothetical protein HNY73_013551 [Argiope bruennichi]|uniref:Integrase catalytic domain-containing protein n=1 Tax=Argiope bruennichi TaxID=94029 RepID=A0A8T0EYE2_ARGBR|nr:hypothetical protein HNY73_013551 [Argiope bruennichi]
MTEINEQADSHLKVLGLVWNNIDDTLGLDLRSLFSNFNDSECTKRNVLHTAAKLFDPPGFISPFLIRIKCLLQELWQAGVGLDEVFSGQLKENWHAWCKEIKDLQNFKTPRYYFPDTNFINKEDLQLHVFSDASLRSFGAVAYLRITGRLGKTTHLSTYEKHPIILPPKVKLTKLLIWESHKRVFHSGVSHTLVLGRCTIYKRFNSFPGSQVIAPLSDIRVEQSAPFTIIGVDFAGPLFVKDSINKQYILLITCAATRSVHLELVGDLTTDTFLLAFRRFISRRGLCSVVVSDNARIFKRAELEIKLIWNVLNHADVKNFYSANGINWKYIVERTAWWGGFYERMNAGHYDDQAHKSYGAHSKHGGHSYGNSDQLKSDYGHHGYDKHDHGKHGYASSYGPAQYVPVYAPKVPVYAPKIIAATAPVYAYKAGVPHVSEYASKVSPPYAHKPLVPVYQSKVAIPIYKPETTGYYSYHH